MFTHYLVQWYQGHNQYIIFQATTVSGAVAQFKATFNFHGTIRVSPLGTETRVFV